MTENPDIVIDVLADDTRWQQLGPVDKLVDKAVHTTLEMLQLAGPYEISVVLTDDVSIQALNREYRGKDKPTNVLSFSQDDTVLLGDIILAFETVAEEAAAQDKTMADHVRHLLVHGLLHLLGHDHETDPEAEAMEALEVRICASLGIKNPYEGNDKLHETVP